MRAVMRFIHVVLVAIAIACTSCQRATGKPTVRLEVVAVDDTTDPFGKDLPANLPRGLTIESETVRSAPGPEAEVRRVRYASLVDAAGETIDAAITRVDPWLRGLPLPPGARFAWRKMPSRIRVFQARAFILTADAVVTSDDIVEAKCDTSTPEPSVMVTLSKPGQARFAKATLEWTGRRLATLVDGKVLGAYVVISEVTGGQMMVLPNAANPDEKADAADTLARQLGGR